MTNDETCRGEGQGEGAGTLWAHHRTAILLAALIVAAILVDLGSFHRLENGDSIVPVLVSLQRWTPFYWDQERYGMLVPLLALPFRHPLANLLVQRGLLVLAGLGAIVLLARHVLAGRDWPLAGMLAAGGLVAVAPAPWLFEILGSQPYGLSLALALGGLAVAEPGADGRRTVPRLAGGLLLVVAAHWVNAATGVLLLALAFARAAADALDGEPGGAVRARLGIDAGLLAIGLVAGQSFLWLYPALTGYPLRLDMGPLPLSSLPRAWSAFFGGAWSEAGAWRAVDAAAAAAGVALLALPSQREHMRAALLRAAALAAAAVAYAAFAGSLRWVQANAFGWRYFGPSAMLVHLAAASLVAEPLARMQRAARPAAAAALLLVPAAALAAYGPPSLARVRADLDGVAGSHTEDVIAARCDLVAGTYWSVWPAVFHALVTLRERGDGRPVWGITHRLNPTVPQWSALPRESLRICRPRGEDREAERWLRSYHLWPVRLVETHPTVDVLAPGGPSRESAEAGAGSPPGTGRPRRSTQPDGPQNLKPTPR